MIQNERYRSVRQRLIWRCLNGLFVVILASLPSTMVQGDELMQPPGETAPDHFWVVSLAWSPEFCHNAPEFHEEPQCAEAHGFVLTSLEPWSGGSPVSSCAKPDEEVPVDIMNWILDTMFNRRWIRHQWMSRGGCAGLSSTEYFVQAQYLGSRVVIPDRYRQPSDIQSVDIDQVRDTFGEANPTMGVDAVTVRCQRNWLSEVRFCVSEDFSYRQCTVPPADSCHNKFKVRGIDPTLKIAQSQ